MYVFVESFVLSGGCTVQRFKSWWQTLFILVDLYISCKDDETRNNVQCMTIKQLDLSVYRQRATNIQASLGM